MAIQIENNTILRALVRKGTDAERKTIVLEQGELGYTTDTSRLFIGDGTTSGGTLTSNKFLGSVGNFTAAGGLNPEEGDLVKISGNLYAKNSSNIKNAIDGYINIGLGATTGQGLKINSSDEIDVQVDGTSISFNNNNKLTINSVGLEKIDNSLSNSLLGNNTGNSYSTEIAIENNSLLGRNGSNAIASISFADVVKIGLESTTYANNTTQFGVGQVNTGTDGRITWGGVPKLAVYNSATSTSLTVPDYCNTIKVTLIGAGSNGTGNSTGNAGGSLTFYAPISRTPGKKYITINVGEGGPTGGDTSVTFFYIDDVSRTFTAKGGPTPSGYPNNYSPPSNTIPSGIAHGDVIEVLAGGFRDNNSKDRQARIPSILGAYGPGSAGMDAGSQGDSSGKDGIVIIEYYDEL